MKAIRKKREIPWQPFENCHDGAGVLHCQSLLDGLGSQRFGFMHCDDIKKGVTIGVHEHTASEEIYYLVSGRGILTYDGAEYPMEPGDISLCGIGHSHGFAATEDSVLVVVG